MSIYQVIAEMDHLNELHQHLVDAAKEKHEAILKNDMQHLTQIMNKETRLLKQVNESEIARVDAANVFLTEKGIRSQLKLTITEMTRLVFDQEEKQHLLDSQRRLLDTLLTLKNLNNTNKEMIDQSLSFIDYSLNLIVSRPEDDMLYQNPNQQHVTRSLNRNFFDART